MSSVLKVGEIQDPTNGNTALTIDSAGNIKNSGAVVQVQQTATTTLSVVSSASFAAVGLDVNITPKFADSKILITVCGCFGHTQDTYGGARLFRDSTAIGGGDDAGNRKGYSFAINERSVDAPWEAYMASYTFLDSPATTSQITYSLKLIKFYGTAITCNKSYNDVDADYGWRTMSTITAQEIAQ